MKVSIGEQWSRMKVEDIRVELLPSFLPSSQNKVPETLPPVSLVLPTDSKTVATKIYLLVVEKEGVFRRLVEDQICT